MCTMEESCTSDYYSPGTYFTLKYLFTIQPVIYTIILENTVFYLDIEKSLTSGQYSTKTNLI